MSKKMKLAMIGTGNMGSAHLNNIKELDNCELAALCDTNKEKADARAAETNVKGWYDHESMLAKGGFDGVLIATPHYDHTTIAIRAFELGYHVLSEKPVGVHAKDITKTVQAYQKAKKENPGLKFGAMFQQRTATVWKKVKELLDSGELGKLVRTTWIITDWFRTQSYYDNGGWRATWKGEGGGVLLNQSPHQLDLYQWLVGMPSKVTGFAGMAKYHDIEVEDEVTAFFEHDNGMTGHFITTTGEAPGTNRLEIVGEHGKLVVENSQLTFYRNRKSMLTFLETSEAGFAKPECWKIDIPVEKDPGHHHRTVIHNFAEAVLNETDLIAAAPEGYNSVTMANMILLSSFKNMSVEMPFDEDEYEEHLKTLIKNSTFTKKNVVESIAKKDMSKSF